jgi:serralysin
LLLTGAGAINGTGNGGANTITGNGGANVLSGGAGADTLTGGGGLDDLYGGTGQDDLTGGTGADNFRFDSALSAATNVDDILDFSVVDDTIQLDRDIFTGITVDGTLAAGAFHAGTAAADADDRIVYNAATGEIFYDADGVGGAAQILFAAVNAGTALTNADFVGYI